MGNHDFPGQNTVGVAIGSGPRSFPKKRLSLDSIKDEKFYEFFKIRFNFASTRRFATISSTASCYQRLTIEEFDSKKF